MIHSIIFLGMAGVGKSSIGKSVAQELGLSFFDTDKLISNHYNQSIQDIITKYGDSKFNEIESTFVMKFTNDLNIISPGGSFIYSTEVIQNIRSESLLIYLYDEPHNIKKRISNLHTRGIVGLDKKSFEQLCSERHDLYQAVAHIQFNLNQFSFDEISRQIIEYLKLLLHNRL